METVDDIIFREKLKTASISKRALAYLIDDLLISFIILITLWSSFENANNPEQIIALINDSFLNIIILRFIYQLVFVHLYGATLGKFLLKLKVLQVDTLDKPSIMNSATRSSLRVFSEIFFYFGFIFAFFNQTSKQTLHDKVAKTVVIDVSN